MRIIVVSDTHGRTDNFFDIIKKHREDSDLFLHLGDGAKDVELAKSKFTDINILGVRGNCDFTFSDDYPIERVIPLDGATIFMTHGHEYYVKTRTDNICYKSRTVGADIALFGHTHKQLTDYDDGLYIMNPGSTSVSHGTGHSYGIIDITSAGIVCNIVDIK